MKEMGEDDYFANLSGPDPELGWEFEPLAGQSGPADPARGSGELAGADEHEVANPPVVGSGNDAVGTALAEGSVVAIPGVGGYSLAVRVGTPGAEARLKALAADPDGPHYAVGHRDDVRALTSGWSAEVERLLDRCWPGPVDVFLPRAAPEAEGGGEDGGDAVDDEVNDEGGNHVAGSGADDQGEEEGHGVTAPQDPDGADHRGWAVTVGMPNGRAIRRLCKEHGPWRTVPLNFNDASEVAHAFRVTDVALVVDGGRCDGELPTLVDATVSPVRVLREGALPSNFIEGTMAMGARKRWFGRSRSKEG